MGSDLVDRQECDYSAPLPLNDRRQIERVGETHLSPDVERDGEDVEDDEEDRGRKVLVRRDTPEKGDGAERGGRHVDCENGRKGRG